MEAEFQTIFARCAFLDVHKKTVKATVRILEGEQVRRQTRRWGTLTDEVTAMADWMEAQGVAHVGMESTGGFRKPLYNILESRFTVILVHARHLKQVTGRKSHMRDSQWGAHLLQFGLLRGSFIPPRWQRELRDLTRHRTGPVSSPACGIKPTDGEGAKLNTAAREGPNSFGQHLRGWLGLSQSPAVGLRPQLAQIFRSAAVECEVESAIRQFRSPMAGLHKPQT